MEVKKLLHNKQIYYCLQIENVATSILKGVVIIEDLQTVSQPSKRRYSEHCKKKTSENGMHRLLKKSKDNTS